ncbi:beta-N-acetylhexosaminidase [Luteolibacter marinus]|uniref:beta-N-acetylhexosaminidase n=1 Tax=Luteolibacter marinus TaxID=2776705 RepID=UPI001868044F|nr:beta-N-acetylhexosaminidase [Luteolibacter marinus]
MNGHLLLLGVRGPEIAPDEADLFRRLQPAGYILFTRNIESAAQTRRLTDALRELSFDEPIIAIDQEGGRVTRTKDIAPALPSANALAAKGDDKLSARAGVLTADQLRLLGFNLDFAPVLDLDHHPELQNALRGRCWGRDPQRVIDHAGQWNRWLRKRGVLSCAKHFPACGRATSDPHFDLPVSDATLADLLKEDIIPYTALMPELDSVMLAHVLFPAVDPDRPASLSKRMVTGFLRDQLGFDKHLVLTDDLDMGAIADRYPDNTDVVAAIEAGNDLAMICHRTDRAEAAAIELGKLPAGVTVDAEKRIARFRKKLNAPLKWSESHWEKLCGEIADLAGEVPEAGPVLPNSPVADY